MSINIRAAHKTDYGRIAEIFDHPAVVEQSSQHPYLGVDGVTRLFEARGDKLVLLVAEVEDNVEGYIGINLNSKPREKHVASFGMAVHPDSHGKGIGSCLLQKAIELADGWLNIIRFELGVYTDNEAGISLYKKYGFEIEGESRFAAYKNGNYVGLLMMARINPNQIG